jgi:hypothetical protein
MLSACGSPGLEFGTAQTRNRLRALRAIWCGVTWIPLLGAAGSGILVALAHFHALPLAAAEFFRGTVFWHLAFWEWAGSAAVFLFFATPVLILGRRRPPPAIPR